MVSAIEEKKKTKIDTKKDRITNDWGKFVKSIFYNLLTTLLIVLLVCNSIFYSQRDNLDSFFPTAEENYFSPPTGNNHSGGHKYSDKRGGNGKCRNHAFGFSGPTIDRPDMSGAKEKFLSKAGLNGNVYGWPYSMYDEGEEEQNTFKNWFAKVIAKTFIAIRSIWKKMYGIIPPTSPDWFAFIWGPIWAIVALIISSICGIACPIFYGFTESVPWGILYSIIFVPLCLAVMGSYSYSHFLYLLMIGFAPLLVEYQKFVEIAICNKNKFGLLFGALVVGSCFDYLLPSVGYSAMILWIIMFIKAMLGK
jgi:hypothetical protein